MATPRRLTLFEEINRLEIEGGDAVLQLIEELEDQEVEAVRVTSN